MSEEQYCTALFERLDLNPNLESYHPFRQYLIDSGVCDDFMLSCVMDDSQWLTGLDSIGNIGPRAAFRRKLKELLGTESAASKTGTAVISANDGQQALLNAFEKLSMEISLHLLKSPIPIKRTITPSMGRKSSPECRQWFTQIMETMSLGSNSQMDLFVKPIPSDFTLECAFGEFTFDWKDNTVGEQASYEPLVEYITTTTKAKAKNISNGKGLSGGFFFEVELLTIRPRVGIRNNELRVDHLVPSYLLVLCGRSDVVVWNAEYERPCRTTTRYCIEVKTKSALSTVAGVNGCLREAFLQLIGLNACNPYKSPAVILTDLVDSHHVLYLTRQSNTRSVPCQYNLSIHKFSKFSHALWFAEKHLSDRKQNSRDLFRMDTLPPGSIWSRQQPQEQTQEQLHEQTFDAVEKSESIDDDDQDEYYDNVAIVDTLS